MILTRPAFIDSLQKTLLQESLPGQLAHFKMAHAVRRADVQPDPAEIKEAAVLITLFEKSPADWHLVFIRRGTTHEKDKHGGQIAFPGGKVEPDDRDLMFTALREAEEETSMDLTSLDVLGQLTPLYITVSKFRVHPFVAYSYKTPELIRQQSEVEEILEFPLDAFRDKSSITETRIHLTSGIILNHVPAFEIQGHIIWGATAMIMSELLEVLDRVKG
jgi:8-oxo-dGTP pyrophosphatase MutT (NUDIX family)